MENLTWRGCIEASGSWGRVSQEERANEVEIKRVEQERDRHEVGRF